MGTLSVRAAERLPENYNKLSIPEALGTAKQSLSALASHLKRYNREDWKIVQLYSTEPSKVYSQWKGNNMRTAPPRNRRMMEHITTDHSSLPKKGSSNHHSGRHPRKDHKHEELESTRASHDSYLQTK